MQVPPTQRFTLKVTSFQTTSLEESGAWGLTATTFASAAKYATGSVRSAASSEATRAAVAIIMGTTSVVLG